MNQPVYVKIEEYQEILNILDVLKGNMMKARETLRQINELREKEGKTVDVWSGNLDDIQNKIGSISQALFEPR